MKKKKELLDLMFQYSKLDGTNFEMKLEENDLGRLIREAIALHYNEFERKNIEINIEIPENSIKSGFDYVILIKIIKELRILCIL